VTVCEKSHPRASPAEPAPGLHRYLYCPFAPKSEVQDSSPLLPLAAQIFHGTTIMPKKHKGRREEQKKRKREHDDDAASPKRHKNEDAPSVEDAAFHHDHAADVTQPEGGLTFYGMLDDDEQEYFKRADDMLELNQFDDPDARKLFLDSVYKEADGKELKIANSQSCSRLLERLIQLSSPEQLKGLFQKFSGQ
jgi:nucleolar protein 9